MATNETSKPRVFIDADVVFAASVSPSNHGASLVILRMAEITLIDAITSEQVITEVERNLSAKLPIALPKFRLLVKRALHVSPNPDTQLLTTHNGKADPKDLPLLVAAYRENCPVLVTFNVRHFKPGIETIAVMRPGEYVQRIRHILTRM